VWSRLARVRVTVGYVVALSAVMVTCVVLGPTVRDRITAHASTNLHNLAHGRLGTLLGSAFVADIESVYLWLPGLICLLAVAELFWHGHRLVLVFFTGHIGATVLVAAGLVVAVRSGWLPWSITRVVDVGMSYGVMAVSGALTAALPARARPWWFAWWLPAAAAVIVAAADFTDIGHVVALLIGMVISIRLDSAVAWTPARRVLFAVGIGFGYAVLVYTPELAAVGVPASVLGVAVLSAVGLLARRRPSL